MMAQELKIRKASNGYVISWLEDEDSHAYSKKEIVVEEDEYDDSFEAKAAQKMLWAVLEYFGVAGSKHEQLRVVTRLEHGSNWECEGCAVCRNQ